MALDLSGWLGSGSVTSMGGSIWSIAKIFILAVFIGGIVGLIVIFIIRITSFKYGVIIFEKRANEVMVPYIDRARVKTKGVVKKIVFMNTKGSMESMPYDFLFPTIKRNIFDMFKPKETFIVFSYRAGEFIPVSFREEFGKYKFIPEDSGAELWADMEKKGIRNKYNKDPFWKHPNFAMGVVAMLFIISMILIVVLWTKVCG